MSLLLLLLFIKLCAGQLALDGTHLPPLVPHTGSAAMMMPQISSLDVQCQMSGMTVEVSFTQPFNGVIFSKGHFSNPACRYVDANSGKSNYTFVIPMNGCGTKSFNTQDGESMSFENIIMMQNEEIVQEIWDIARKISCDWATHMEKLITFRPFAVDMLQAEEVRYSGDDVMCWMDIQLGKGPFANPVDGIVKMGDEMTIVVYSKDGGADYDMLVKNCYAYDSQDLESSTKLQLSDEQGCLLKPKLMNYFSRTRSTGNTGADLIAYAKIYAFKFPDKMDVFLSCEVELCKGGCDNICDGAPSDIVESFATTIRRTVTASPPIVDICVTNPSLPQCCAKNPNHPACADVAATPPKAISICAENPGLPQCCASNPNHPVCTTTTPHTTTTLTTAAAPDPCDLNPLLPQCCRQNPNLPQCTTTTPKTTTSTLDPCIRSPGSTFCCARNPSHPSCTTTTTPSTTTALPDPCDLNPLLPQCCRQNPNLPQCTTTTQRTTIEIFNPCIRDPGSILCCASNSNHRSCKTTTVTTTPSTTTTRRPTDPCIRNPGSSQCCKRKPNHPSCPTDKPCESEDDPRPQCKPTTPAAPTTRDLTYHAFHRGEKPSGRRRRPTYGSRLTPDVLNGLSSNSRQRRGVSYVDPPLPPPSRTIAMTKFFRVVGANDLTFSAARSSNPTLQTINSVCVSTSTFYVGLLLLTLMLVAAVLVATFTSLRLHSIQLSTKQMQGKDNYYKQ